MQNVKDGTIHKESINIKIFPQTKLNWSSAIQFHSICLPFFFFCHFPLYHHYHHYSTAHSTPVWGKHLRYIITTETYAFRMILSLSLSLSLSFSLSLCLFISLDPSYFFLILSIYRSIDLSLNLLSAFQGIQYVRVHFVRVYRKRSIYRIILLQ